MPFNDLFRIVHDVFGHAKEGVGFRAAGEENAWRSHARMYSPEALPAMTAETRGQNSWVNYGPQAAANRGASAAGTIYAPQKIGMLPDWVIQSGRMSPLAIGALGANVRPDDATLGELGALRELAERQGWDVDVPTGSNPLWGLGRPEGTTLAGLGDPFERAASGSVGRPRPCVRTTSCRRGSQKTSRRRRSVLRLVLGAPVKWPVKVGSLVRRRICWNRDIAQAGPREGSHQCSARGLRCAATRQQGMARCADAGCTLPAICEEYPAVGPPEMVTFKDTGKVGPAKLLTPEAEAFEKARTKIAKRI